MKFVILSRLTEDGANTVKKRPHRIKEVNEELSGYGVKVLDQYALLGNYDFVTIVEAESNKQVMNAMLELTSRGTIETITMPAIPVDELTGQ
ncbi:MAG: GYD domain-containing protein [Candidatus Hadarchaeota archaeon]